MAKRPRSSPPRREVVIDLLTEEGRALRAREIAAPLGIEQSQLTGLRQLLTELVRDGLVQRVPGDRFKLAKSVRRAAARPDRTELHEGVLTVHPRGFGFVASPELAEDAWIAPESMAGALHGDTVRFRIVARTRRGSEAAIDSVVRRRLQRVAGVLHRRGRRAWLQPDDSRIRGPIALARSESQGHDGDAAVAEITQYPERVGEGPSGVLLSVLGAPGDPNVEVAKVLLREAIEEDHPPAALAEAAAFGDQVDAAAFAGREDFTAIPLPTIDPEDARDHDDAVWVERDAQGRYRAWIAIADVSHYVREGSALDAAALARGNSIYLPDRAIPMLPHALSSNLCSLLPHVPRLCLCVVVDLDASGQVKSARIAEGFLRSAAKLTYSGVAHALALSPTAAHSPEAEALRDGLRVAWDLAQLLRARRMRRGALDFDVPEARVLLDEETGAPLAVQRRAHDPGVKQAYQLVEELMLLANEVVAEFMAKHDVPTLYRVHAPPDENKLQRFVALCRELEGDFSAEDALEPKRLARFLRRISGHPRQQVLHLLLLRAMQQARYHVLNTGHFGLRSSAYLHFTSPIRRYPDLVVHRALREQLRGNAAAPKEEAVERLRNAAAIANQRERGALEIEREVVDLYRCLLMRAHLGDSFAGTVTGMGTSGLFVALDEPFVDVLVRLDELGRDTYTLDEEGLHAVGRRSGHRIALGDRMELTVERVDILRRTVYARRIADPSREEVPLERERQRRAKKKSRSVEREPRGKRKLERKTKSRSARRKDKRR